MSTEKSTPHTFRSGVYLLPNLFTTLGMFWGFYAIVKAIHGDFSMAAVAIIFAVFTDILDGRLARLTNTATEFGKEYDSLTDMVSFGVAPALLIYHAGLLQLGRIGWMACFIYTAMIAMRLARFNTQHMNQDKAYFQGLASPAAATSLATLVWFAHSFHLSGYLFSQIAWVITMLLSMLVISNVRYFSFKQWTPGKKIPFIMGAGLIGVITLISFEPMLALFIFCYTYVLYGPLSTLWRIHQTKRQRRQQKAQS